MESNEISSLPGCYLLVILGEPMCDNHKGKILQRVAKGLLSWNIETTQCDLKHLEQVCDNLIASKRNSLETALLLQHSTDKLAVEVLFNPQISALQQCLRNLLLSSTGHKHIIYAGYSFTGSGSWMLQDGVFRFQDFVDELSDPHITKVLSQYPAGCTLNMHLHCSPIGDWVTNNLENQSFSHLINLSLNPPDSPNGVPGASSLLEFIENSLTTLEKEENLESSPLIGNIRFERPTMYIFPSGQGDCSLFGITGFTMLIDGGFTRYPCFWKFVRHIERLDSIMMTRINESNLWGILHLLKGKQESSMLLKIGYVFCNIADKTDKTGKEEITGYAGIQADANDLVISIIDYGNEIAARLKQIGCSPRQCLRESTPSPLTLYHKVGHGTLEMYVLSPPRDSRLVKDFLSYCNSDRESLPILRTRSAHKNGGKSGQDIAIPISDVMSICCLIVWKPADPNDRITRILFPGSAPQSQIMEGLNSLKDCNLFSSRVCTGLTVKQQSKQKQTVKSTSFKVNEKFASSSTRYRSVSPTLRKSRVTYAKQTSTDLGDKGGDSSESQSSPIKKKSNTLLTQKTENSREKATEESLKKTIDGDKKIDKSRTDRKTKPRTSSTSRTSVISKTVAKSSEVSSESTNDKSRAVTRKVQPQVNTKQSPPKAKEKITKQNKETTKDNKQGLVIDYDATDSKIQEARENYSEDDHRDSGKGSEDASPRKIPFLDHIRDEVEPDSLESHDIYGNSEICRDSLEHSEDEVITGDSRSTSQLEQTISREDDEEMKSRSSPIQQDSELQSAMFSSLSSNMTVISGERIDDSDAEVASLTSKIDNNQAYQSTEISRTEQSRRRSNDPSNSHRSLQSELQEIMKQSDKELIESESSIEKRRQSSQINQVDETRNFDSDLVSKENKRYSISGDEDLSTDSQKGIIMNEFDGGNKVIESHESQSDEKIEDDKSDTFPRTLENETANDKIETSKTKIEPNVDSNENEYVEIDAKIIENISDEIESELQKDSIDLKKGELFIDESIQPEIPANKKEQITALITEKEVREIGHEMKQTDRELITTFDSIQDEIRLTIGTNETRKLSLEKEEVELIDQKKESTSESEEPHDSQHIKQENSIELSATEKNTERIDSLAKESNILDNRVVSGTDGSTKENATTIENISYVDSRKESFVSISDAITESVKPQTSDDAKATLERKDSMKVSPESTEEATSKRDFERKESIVTISQEDSRKESVTSIHLPSDEPATGEDEQTKENISRKYSRVVDEIESIPGIEVKTTTRKDSVDLQSKELISSKSDSRKESIVSISDNIVKSYEPETIDDEKLIQERKDSVKVSPESGEVATIRRNSERKESIVEKLEEDSMEAVGQSSKQDSMDSRRQSMASISDETSKTVESEKSDDSKQIGRRKESIESSIIKKTTSERESRKESISYKDSEIIDLSSMVSDSDELSSKGDKNTIERKDSHTEAKTSTHETLTSTGSESNMVVETSSKDTQSQSSIDSSIEKTVIGSTQKDSLEMSRDSSKIEASIGQDAQKNLETTNESNEIINRSSIEVESIQTTITDTNSTFSSSTMDSVSKGNELDLDKNEAKTQSEINSTSSVVSTEEIKLDRKTSIVSLNSEENKIIAIDENRQSSESGNSISNELMNIPYADSSSAIRKEGNIIQSENVADIENKSLESAISSYAVEKIPRDKNDDEDLGNISRGFEHFNKSESTSSEVNTNSDSKFGVFTSVDEETHFYLEDSDSLTQDGRMMTSLPEKSESYEANRISSSIVQSASPESMQVEIDSSIKTKDFDSSINFIASKTHKDSGGIEKVKIESGFVEETRIQTLETLDSYDNRLDNQLEARRSSSDKDSELDKIEAIVVLKRSSVTDHPTDDNLQEYAIKSSATSSLMRSESQYDSIEGKNITKQELKTSEKVSESNSVDLQTVDRELKADKEAAISRPKSDNSLESNKEFPASECLKEEMEIYNSDSVKSAVITFENSHQFGAKLTTVDKNSSKSENESLTNDDSNGEILTSEIHSSINVTSSHKFPPLPGQTLDKSSCDIVDKGVSIRSATSDGENLAKTSTNTELFSAIHRETKLTNIILPEVIKEETIDKMEETEKLSFSPIKVTSDEFISKVEASPGTSFSANQFVTSADMPSVHLRRSAQMAGQVLYEIPDEEDSGDLSQSKIDQNSKSHEVKGSEVHPEASHSQEIVSLEKIDSLVDDDHKTVARKRDLESENTSTVITSPQDSRSGLCCFPRSIEVDGLKKEREVKTEKTKSPERLETIVTFQTENLSEQQIKEKESTLKEWGNPLGLPKPTDPTDSKGNRSTSKSRAKSSDRTDAQRNYSTRRSEPTNDPIKPIHLDLAYIPHHGDRNYCNADYFKKIRARYYVLSAVNPSKEVLNALIEGKQSWEDANAEVTLIPSHESEVLCLWMASNQKILETLHIEVAPSASRCSVILQDQESSCSAYRVEF